MRRGEDLAGRNLQSNLTHRGWLKEFHDDRTLVIRAVAQARKAADYMLHRPPKSSGWRNAPGIVVKAAALSKTIETVP